MEGIRSWKGMGCGKLRWVEFTRFDELVCCTVEERV